MIYVYDGSFDGFLTAIFEAYASKEQPLQIISLYRWEPSLFDASKQIATDINKSKRVWKGIITRSNDDVASMFYLAFASGIEGIENELYNYLQKLFADTTGIFHQNLLDDNSFTLYQTARKVKMEMQRFYGFVRFQETTDGLFFAVIEPDHNIASLIAPHFARRFADRPWVIYDRRRDKGVYFDTSEIVEITLTDKQFDDYTGQLNSGIKAENEDFYRQLWKTYYKAINIKERKNTRLMFRLLPRRYHKYLPEKT